MTVVFARRAPAHLLARLLLTLTLVVGVGLRFATPALAQDAPPAGTANRAALEAAVSWLLGQQAEDGGFPGFDGSSDPGTTCDAVYALAAAGAVGLDVSDSLQRAYDFLSANAQAYAEIGVGQSAKLALAAVAAGGDPRDVGGVSVLDLVAAGADPTTGLYGSGVFDHALAILALVAAGEPVPSAALDALAATQLEDGSWAFDGSTAPGAGDSNTTALVIQALVATGQPDSPLIRSAVAYLATVQAESGGFGYQPGEPTAADANSTALVLQALLAVDLDSTFAGAGAPAVAVPAAPDVLAATRNLARFQNSSGAFRYTDEVADDNLFATVQAIPALAGLPLPIAASEATGAAPAT